MVGYDRILWLDDTPDAFLAALPVIARNAGSSLDLNDLVSRTDFAYDFVSGKRFVASGSHALHILDGDFPIRVPDSRVAFLDAYLRKILAGEAVKLNYPAKHEMGHITANNFVRFHDDVLKGKDARVIVYSASGDAVWYAREMGFPFYLKSTIGDPVENIRQYLEMSNRRMSHKLSPEGWEHGGTFDLVRRYLV